MVKTEEVVSGYETRRDEAKNLLFSTNELNKDHVDAMSIRNKIALLDKSKLTLKEIHLLNSIDQLSEYIYKLKGKYSKVTKNVRFFIQKTEHLLPENKYEARTNDNTELKW